MKIILKCGFLFNGIENFFIPNVWIKVDDNSISYIGSKDDIEYDSTYEVVDLNDKYVLPGLIDCHVHTALSGTPDYEYQITKNSVPYLSIAALRNARSLLMAGFTTVRDAGICNYINLGVRNAINAGIFKGPRMMVCGPMLSITGGHADSNFSPSFPVTGLLGETVDGIEDLRKEIRKNFKSGVDYVKIAATGGLHSAAGGLHIQQYTFEELKVIADEAKREGKISAAHAYAPGAIKDAILAGIHSIEHGVLMDDECIALLVEHRCWVVPTLIALDVIVQKGTAGGLVEHTVRKAMEASAIHAQSIKKAYVAGVQLGFGTDSGTSYNYHGVSGALEFIELQKIGVDPFDCLVMATFNAAKLLQWDDRIGSIEAGKLADIIAVDRNPIDDMTAMQKIDFVMKDGDILKRSGKAYL